MPFKYHFIALASAALLSAGASHAADGQAKTTSAATTVEQSMAPAKTNSTVKVMHAEREQLAQKLRAGKTRADLDKILQDNGFRISAINEDKKDYLEYEVVKGQNSYEVQMDFSDGPSHATKIQVEPNMWRADTTKRMLKDANYKHAGALAADPKGRYSDRRYTKGWNDEKDRLEKALPAHLKVTEYKTKLQALGYKVTAVNDREKDYVEYEIAKGDNSYEVQIDLDPATQTAKKIDVTSNLWEAEATDRATDKKS